MFDPRASRSDKQKTKMAIANNSGMTIWAKTSSTCATLSRLTTVLTPDALSALPAEGANRHGVDGEQRGEQERDRETPPPLKPI